MINEAGEVWRAGVGSGQWEKVETERGELAPGMRDGGWARGFTAFSKQIVKALREGRTTVDGAATFEDGYYVQMVLDAARRSHESACWVKIERSED